MSVVVYPTGGGAGTPETNRTSDLPLRRGLLYPLSYRGGAECIVASAIIGAVNPVATESLRMLRRATFCVLALLLAPARAQPQSWAWDDGTVPYVNTPVEIVERMMRMAEVGRDDQVIDLGSGDGRLVIAAAKRGASGLGVDLDPNLVRLATQNAEKAKVGERAKFEVKDIFETDLTRA